MADPFAEKNLRHRFLLFQLLCLPSVLSQTVQGFTWLLLVDQDLPAEYRTLLAQLIRDRKQTHIVEYGHTVDLTRLQWLKPWLTGNPDYIITTNLDDDDALPRTFIAATQAHIRERDFAVPPFYITATDRAVQWDLVCSRKSPFGWQRRWDRRYRERTWPTSAGYSLTCKLERSALSVYAIDHSVCEVLFDPHPDLLPFHRFSVEQSRRRLLEAFPSGADRISRWGRNSHYHNLSNDTGNVLIGNHFSNQQGRLLRHRSNREKVIAGESFPEIDVNWDIFSGNRRMFSTNIGNIVWMINRSRDRQSKVTTLRNALSTLWYLKRL